MQPVQRVQVAQSVRPVQLEQMVQLVRLVQPAQVALQRIGTFAGTRVSPDGHVVSDAQWAANEADWLATPEDRAFVASLMGRVAQPGKFANWIAPPAMGVNRQPVDFEYVRFN